MAKETKETKETKEAKEAKEVYCSRAAKRSTNPHTHKHTHTYLSAREWFVTLRFKFRTIKLKRERHASQAITINNFLFCEKQ